MASTLTLRARVFLLPFPIRIRISAFPSLCSVPFSSVVRLYASASLLIITIFFFLYTVWSECRPPEEGRGRRLRRRHPGGSYGRRQPGTWESRSLTVRSCLPLSSKLRPFFVSLTKLKRLIPGLLISVCLFLHFLHFPLSSSFLLFLRQFYVDLALQAAFTLLRKLTGWIPTQAVVVFANSRPHFFNALKEYLTILLLHFFPPLLHTLFPT